MDKMMIYIVCCNDGPERAYMEKSRAKACLNVLKEVRYARDRGIYSSRAQYEAIAHWHIVAVPLNWE